MADTTNAASDEVSLEDLVRQTAPEPEAEPMAQGEAPAQAAAENAAPPAKSNEDLSGDQIDSLLSAEDPNFAASLTELKKQGEDAAGTEVDIDPLDIERLRKEKISRFRFQQRAKELAQALKVALIAGLKNGFLKLKKGLHDFKDLPRSSKILCALALGFGVLAVSALKFALTGSLSLGLEPKFVRSFATVADAQWEYDPKEPLDDFADPLYHPEHVITLDRIVVNLKPDRENENPMGLFAFYIEASSQEAAVELKDRDGEVRDLISRSLEQISFDELSTVPGKEKTKVILRKNLNLFLSRGQVRRVFLKNVVLKP